MEGGPEEKRGLVDHFFKVNYLQLNASKMKEIVVHVGMKNLEVITTKIYYYYYYIQLC